MKKIFLLASLMSTIAFSAKSQSPTEMEKQQVQKTVLDMFQGIAESDAEKVKQHCTADITLLENGVVWNLDSLVSKINARKSEDYKRINKLDFRETDINGNVAWTYYNNEADVTLNGQSVLIKWLESVLLLKEGNEWKIKLLHSTLIEKIKK